MPEQQRVGPWVTIDRHFHPTDAHIAAGQLSAAGIPVNLVGIHHASMNWLITPALGGIRVQVPQEHVSEARELLAVEHQQITEPEETETCPQCGSAEVGNNTLSKRLSFLLIHLFSLPFPWGRKRRHCRDCGHSWEEGDASRD